MIHWKSLPKKYRSHDTAKRCKVFPKGMGSFIRDLTLNKYKKYEGIDIPLSDFIKKNMNSIGDPDTEK